MVMRQKTLIPILGLLLMMLLSITAFASTTFNISVQTNVANFNGTCYISINGTSYTVPLTSNSGSSISITGDQYVVNWLACTPASYNNYYIARPASYNVTIGNTYTVSRSFIANFTRVLIELKTSTNVNGTVNVLENSNTVVNASLPITNGLLYFYYPINTPLYEFELLTSNGYGYTWLINSTGYNKALVSSLALIWSLGTPTTTSSLSSWFQTHEKAILIGVAIFVIILIIIAFAMGAGDGHHYMHHEGRSQLMSIVLLALLLVVVFLTYYYWKLGTTYMIAGFALPMWSLVLVGGLIVVAIVGAILK